MAPELGNLESVACGSPPRRAYPPQWSCGREAEGGGLLNRYRVVKPYRGFESLRLRHLSVLWPCCCPTTKRFQFSCLACKDSAVRVAGGGRSGGGMAPTAESPPPWAGEGL